MADPNQDFVPDTSNQNFIQDPPQESILDKAKKVMNWSLSSLLPEKQTGHEDYIYQPTSSIGRAVFPGGIQVPNWHHIYEDVIRPTVSPIGLAAVGGGIAENMIGGKATPESAPKPPTKYLPLPRGKAATSAKGFVHGDEGIAENRPYTIDMTPVNKGSGTVLPREAGEVTQVPPEVAATYGTGLGKPTRAPLSDNITGYSPTKQIAGTAPEQPQLPAGSGFTGGNLGGTNYQLSTTRELMDPGGPAPAAEPFKAAAPQKPVYDIDAHIKSLTDAIKNQAAPKAEQPAEQEPSIDLSGQGEIANPKDYPSQYNLTTGARLKNALQDFIPDKLQELATSEEGSLKIDPVLLENVKDTIRRAIKSSQRIILPNIYDKVKNQVNPKQFSKIIDDMLSNNEVESKVDNKQVPINASTDYVRNPTDAIAKLTEALKTAAPQREAQEQLYSQERGKRITAYQAVKTPGLQGAYQRMSTLKGELPKVDYQGLNLNRVDVDNLMDAINNNQKITGWEKPNATEGLLKILTGSGVPQRSELALLGRVFGPQMSEIIEMHGGIGLAGRGVMPLRALADLNSSMKTAMSTMDASFPLRQGGGLIHEGAWLKSFANMWKMIPDKGAYEATMDAVESRPKYLMGRAAGLDLTSLNDVTTREESFPMKNLIEKIPGVGASERMAMGFINKLRADVFDKWTDLAQAAGEDIGTVDNPSKLTKDIAKVINNSTGRGSLGKWQKIAPELNQVFYSPKFIASRLTMLNPMYYTNLEPFARKQALKSALAIAGTDVLTNGLLAAGGAKIGTNLLSSDWMKAKMGNTRIENSAGFQSYLVALTRFIKGETDSKIKYGPLAPTRESIAGNFFANKTSPLANLAITLAAGSKDKEGNLTRFGKPINIPVEVAQKFMSMFPKDVYDLYHDDPNLFPLGEAHFDPAKLSAIPMSMFGAGVQTYDSNADKPVSRFRLR